MPKRFLPNLKKTNKQQQTNPKQIKEQKENKPDVESVIAGDSLSYEYPDAYYPLIKVYKVGIALVSFVFCFLLIINSYYNMQLRHLIGEQKKLISRLGEVRETEGEIIDTNSRIEYYKNILTNRNLLEPKIAFLMHNISINNVFLNNLHIEAQGFEIGVAVQEPAVFAKMINDFMQEKVAYMVIQSANYNSYEQSYQVTLKGVFKSD